MRLASRPPANCVVSQMRTILQRQILGQHPLAKGQNVGVIVLMREPRRFSSLYSNPAWSEPMAIFIMNKRKIK